MGFPHRWLHSYTGMTNTHVPLIRGAENVGEMTMTHEHGGAALTQAAHNMVMKRNVFQPTCP